MSTLNEGTSEQSGISKYNHNLERTSRIIKHKNIKIRQVQCMTIQGRNVCCDLSTLKRMHQSTAPEINFI